MEYMQQLFIHNIYTLHPAFFCHFYIICTDLSKNVIYNIGLPEHKARTTPADF